MNLLLRGVSASRANPTHKHLRWELPEPPSNEDLERIAIAKRLWERGLATAVTDIGFGDYSVHATAEADALHAVFDDYLRARHGKNAA